MLAQTGHQFPYPQDLIIWQDADLLVANKPSGLPTLVDGYEPQAPYLVGLLKQVCDPLWVVHRLDRGASGVIVFARSAAAHRNLNRQFEQRQVYKIYHALVQGAPPWETYSVALALRADGDRRHRSVVDARRGKPALTDLRCLERFEAYTLVEAQPHSGRPHQIRAHLAALGYPLVGDALYGGDELPGLGRLGLHACSLRFFHPRSSVEVSFEAPYPPSFAEALARLQSGRLAEEI